MIKFKTFSPTTTFMGSHNERRSAVDHINEWLEHSIGIEIISWQATTAGDDQELHIIVQYKEK